MREGIFKDWLKKSAVLQTRTTPQTITEPESQNRRPFPADRGAAD